MKNVKDTKMIKILLVEDDEIVRNSFAIAIHSNSKFSLVGMTGRQNEAMEILMAMDVDVLILDLELEEGDGIHLLEEMNLKLEKMPEVISVTNTRSETILSYVRERGVDFVYAKNNNSYSPQNVLEIIEMTLPYYKKKLADKTQSLAAEYNIEKEQEYQQTYVEHELEKMGFKSKKLGTVLLAEAICIMMNAKSNQMIQVTNDIYPVIAAKREITSASVEKSMRNAIERVWKHTDMAMLERFYPYYWDCESGRPTNTDFIFNMSEKLKG